MCVNIRGTQKKGEVRACLWELRMEGCLEQGLSYEVGALVAVFINKGRQWMRGVEEWDTPKIGVGPSMRNGVGVGSGGRGE